MQSLTKYQNKNSENKHAWNIREKNKFLYIVSFISNVGDWKLW